MGTQEACNLRARRPRSAASQPLDRLLSPVAGSEGGQKPAPAVVSLSFLMAVSGNLFSYTLRQACGMRLSRGKGRTEVVLDAERFGSDFVVRIFNVNAHVGAVAVADYDAVRATASVSVIARPGHREGRIACNAARRISKAFGRSVCVVAGIHIEKASGDEIRKLVRNASVAVSAFIKAAGYEKPGARSRT
jgi:hypothetical protein